MSCTDRVASQHKTNRKISEKKSLSDANTPIQSHTTQTHHTNTPRIHTDAYTPIQLHTTQTQRDADTHRNAGPIVWRAVATTGCPRGAQGPPPHPRSQSRGAEPIPGAANPTHTSAHTISK